MDAGNIFAVEKTMNELGFLTNYQQTQLPVATNYQQGSTNFQQGSTNFQQGSTNFQLDQQPVSSSQILVTSSQNPVALYGLGCQAKQDLDVLVATGKTRLLKQATNSTRA